MGLISSRGRILTPLARHDHAPQIYLGRLSSISTSTHVPAARWMDITLDFNWHIGHKRSSTQVSAYHFCIGGVGPLTLTTTDWMIEFMGVMIEKATPTHNKFELRHISMHGLYCKCCREWEMMGSNYLRGS